MKIGIFGSSNVGRTIAERFIADGDKVMIGTRDTKNTMERDDTDHLGHPPYKEWQAKNPHVKLGTFSETAAFGDIIVLATLGNATQNAIEMAGKENFKKKVVIDMTNPLDMSKGVPPAFTGSPGNSLGEKIQEQLPEAKVVKAFNSLAVQLIVNPQREEGNPVLVIAGNDEVAKQQVTEIAKRWGWKDVVDYGNISESFLVEAFGMMWITYAFKNNSWSHAFQLLRK